MTQVHRFRPAPEQLSYTFGRREPVLRAGDVLELSTEDCLGGRVRGPGATFARPHLGAVSPYDGVHERLRTIAAEDLAHR